jgi:hypothetical protein
LPNWLQVGVPMANAVTIHQPSWQQGFDDSARSLSSRCPPDADAFSYLSGYLARLNDRQEQSAETLTPADVPAPAAPQPWWRRLVGWKFGVAMTAGPGHAHDGTPDERG